MYHIVLSKAKRLSLFCLLLLISLLLQAFSFSREREIWDKTLVPWPRRQWSGRRYRRHIVVGRLRFLKQRGRVLFCRLGLVAALLVWSGWWPHRPLCWTLLSLPLADAVLSLLSLFWPRVLKGRIYPYLVCRVHDLYLLVLTVLFSEGLSRPRDGHWLLVGGCVRVADGAWARGEIEEDGTWRLEMKGHFITWKPKGFFEERILLVLLRQLRTPQSTFKRPFLRQEWLAEWFGTHQELISRWQKYVGEGGLAKLNGEHDGRVTAPEIRQAILDIWVPNFWLSARQVRERLLAGGHISSVKDISEKSIYQVAQDNGFAEVRRLLRQVFRFTADGPQWRDRVLLERLFELNEVLMARLQAGEGLTLN